MLPFGLDKYHYANSIHHSHAGSRSLIFLGFFMESIHAQPLVRHRLLNDCHVVDNGISTFDTVVVMAATARLYPELKSNSGKHR